MSDQNGADQNKADNLQPSTSAVVARNDDKGASTDGQRTPSEASDNRSGDHNWHMVRWTRSLTIFTALLALVGIGTLVVTSFQLRSMTKQITQMKISNLRLKDAVEQSTRQADAAVAANDLAKTSYLTADRPWLFQVVPQFLFPATPQDVSLSIAATNLGRSPAFSARGKWHAIFDPGDAPAFDEDECDACERYIAVPNNGFQVNEDFAFSKLSPDQLRDLREDKLHFYVLGRFDYDDINGGHHTTTFCEKYISKLSNFGACARVGSNAAD